MAAPTSNKAGFEVLYMHDDVNTWLECEIIDIVTQGGSQLFKVRILPRFSSL